MLYIIDKTYPLVVSSARGTRTVRLREASLSRYLHPGRVRCRDVHSPMRHAGTGGLTPSREEEEEEFIPRETKRRVICSES